MLILIFFKIKDEIKKKEKITEVIINEQFVNSLFSNVSSFGHSSKWRYVRHSTVPIFTKINKIVTNRH